jgi:heme oxygenase (staphylobilin-producing)
VKPERPLFVSVSHVQAAPGGAGVLTDAFSDRLGEVERWPGFVRLEVWQDAKADDRFVMVTWWQSEDDFRAYLRSDVHDRSHARMPGGDLRPRGTGLDRYTLIAR